jgi:hypothetical protein
MKLNHKLCLLLTLLTLSANSLTPHLNTLDRQAPILSFTPSTKPGCVCLPEIVHSSWTTINPGFAADRVTTILVSSALA